VITIGCTGHQTLSPPTRRGVTAALAAHIAGVDDDDLVGLCSLAVGADQIFAHVLLASGGRLHAVIPCRGYAGTFADEAGRQEFERLRAAAHEVTELPFPEPSEEAFMAAGRTVADRCDLLLAVWDGQPAAGLGGTADVVSHAIDQGKSVEIVWPEGSSRA
jgi:hypothetical protein